MQLNKNYVKLNYKDGSLMVPYDLFKENVGFFLEGPYEKINDFLKRNNY